MSGQLLQASFAPATYSIDQSVVQSLSRVRLCDPTDCSTPGFPVLHHLPELAQTRVHRVGDAIQPSRLGPETWRTWKEPQEMMESHPPRFTDAGAEVERDGSAS